MVWHQEFDFHGLVHFPLKALALPPMVYSARCVSPLAANNSDELSELLPARPRRLADTQVK